MKLILIIGLVFCGDPTILTSYKCLTESFSTLLFPSLFPFYSIRQYFGETIKNINQSRICGKGVGNRLQYWKTKYVL